MHRYDVADGQRDKVQYGDDYGHELRSCIEFQYRIDSNIFRYNEQRCSANLVVNPLKSRKASIERYNYREQLYIHPVTTSSSQWRNQDFRKAVSSSIGPKIEGL